MKSRKMTLRKEMLLGLSLLLILAGLFEFAGHFQIHSLSRDAAFTRQANRCERLFDAVDWTNPVDPKTGKASAEWTKAKEKFLAGVDQLAKIKSLTDSDKTYIDNIRKAWKGYESSMPHRTVTGMLAVRSVVKNTLHQNAITAEASLNKALGWTDFALRVAVLAGSLIGVGIVLLVAKNVRNRLEEVRHQLKTVTQSQGTQSPAGAGEEDLKLKAEQLVKAVTELNDFIGQNISQKETAAAKEEQAQDEKVGVN